MRSITLLFAAAMSLAACDLAQAQTVIQTVPQTVTPPCGLVCLGPGETLDAKQCKCVKPASSPARPCALVCVGLDEALDADRCECVKSASSPLTPCLLVCLGRDETLDAKQCKCVKPSE